MAFLLNIQKRGHAIQLSEVQKVLIVWVLKCVCQERGHRGLSEGQACGLVAEALAPETIAYVRCEESVRWEFFQA